MVAIRESFDIDFHTAPDHGRTHGLRRALQLMHEQPRTFQQHADRTIVEVGTAYEWNPTGNGNATGLLAWYAKTHQCRFFSVDASHQSIVGARQVFRDRYADLEDYARFVHCDATKFPEIMGEKLKQIDLLYLDAMDGDLLNVLGHSNQRNAWYLELFFAFEHVLGQQAIVLLDDCDAGRSYLPKGETLVPYLLRSGWKLVDDHHWFDGDRMTCVMRNPEGLPDAA